MPIRLCVALLLSAISSLIGCSSNAGDPAGVVPGPSAATEDIVGGKPDRGRDPAVVALALGTTGLCSGTLVSPRAVLTARHCVSRTSETIECPPVGPQIGSDFDPRQIAVLAGEDVRTAVLVARGESLVVPPGATLCERDIALLVLDREVTTIAAAAVNAQVPVRSGQLLRAVGFGRRSDHGAAGKKYVREHVPVLWADAAELVVGEVTCSGDSGGPAFDEQTGRVVGVVSRGAPGCQGPWARNVFTRTDAFRELLGRALGPDPGPEPSGESARACGPGHRCPNGYHCNAQRRCERVR
jgi:hypothetical protein